MENAKLDANITKPQNIIRRRIREELFGIGLNPNKLPKNVRNYISRNTEFKRDAVKLVKDIHTKKTSFYF